MNLKGIVAITGKPGLFKVIKQTVDACVVETLDAEKKRSLTNATMRMASLDDITVYTEEGDKLLKEIFAEMDAKSATLKVPASNASNDVLKKYFGEILPDYDKERVYISDIKKVIKWYEIIHPMPLFTEKEVEATKEEKAASAALKDAQKSGKTVAKPTSSGKASAPKRPGAKVSVNKGTNTGKKGA